VLVFISAFAACVFGQAHPAPCALDLDQAPTVRGLKLGMTSGEVQSKGFDWVGGILTPDKFGVRSATVLFSQNQDLKGVLAVQLEFVDETLASIHIQYEQQADIFPTGDKFAEQIKQTLRLPSVGWTPVGTESYSALKGQKLTCHGFTLTAGLLVFQPVLHMDSTLHQAIVAQRVAEDKKHRIDSFKP